MKTTELNLIKNDNHWIKIDFLTPYSKGSMIMKESYYLKYQKKIEKRLSNYYWIDYDYKLTLGEYILMDEEHQRIENHIKTLGRYLDYARRHDQEKDIQNYLQDIEFYSNQLLERELTLQDEYKRKEDSGYSKGQE